MADLARDRKTIGSSLDNISDLTVVVADLLRAGPAAASRATSRSCEQLATLLNKPENQQRSSSSSTGCPSR